MDPMVIEVNDIPDLLPPEQTVDQLKIHFLRRSNHGGDVLLVIYPTSAVGRAYVIFESNDVPGVVEFRHLLETDGKSFPIQVKNSHLSRVDMPVETMLDLNMFRRPKEVLELVFSHGFKTKPDKSNVLQLNGSFIKLKLLRSKLTPLQRDTSQSNNGRSLATWNGCSLSGGLDPEFGSKLTSSNHDIMRNTGTQSLYKDLNLDRQTCIHHEPSSSPAYTNVFTTYQKDFRGSDHTSGRGYDTGSEKGAFMASSSTDSPRGKQNRFSPTQDLSMSASVSSSSFDSVGSSGSGMELRSSKISRESEWSQNSSRHSPTRHPSSSASASSFESFGSSASQLATKVLNPTSTRQPGLGQSSRSQKHKNPSRYTPAQHQPRSDSASVFDSSFESQLDPRFSNPRSIGLDESTSSWNYTESSARNYNRHSPTQHQSRPASASAFNSSEGLGSQIEDRSSKTASLESEVKRNYSESYKVNHSSHSSTQHQSRPASTFDSSSEYQMAPRFSNSASISHSGSDESTGSLKYTEPSQYRKKSPHPNKNDVRSTVIAGENPNYFVSHPSSAEDSFWSFSKTLSTSSGRSSSFLVDTETLNYLLNQNPDTVSNISAFRGTEMSVQENAEFTTVTFTGRNCEDAKRNLLHLMAPLNDLLRTQEINLARYNFAHQQQILKKIKDLKEPRVLVKLSDGIVKIIGSSTQSFEIKQKLIGKDPDLSRGRSTQRSSKSQRSSSVPNQRKISAQQRLSSSPEAQARSVTDHHPENAGHKPQDSRDLRTSTSRTTTEPQKHQRNDTTAVKDERKTTSYPAMLKWITPDFSNDFKKKWQKKPI